jgi:hypothetical protein
LSIRIDDNLVLAPMARAHVEIQLLMAEALHSHRMRLLDATRRARQERGWRQYVAALATHYDAEVRQHNLSTPGDINLVLDAWRASGLVKKAPAEVRQVVDDICLAAKHAVSLDAIVLQRLSGANDRAHAGVSALLARQRIDNDLGAAPAELSVIRAHPGDSCASSSPLLGSVTWHFDATARGLWGALQAEMVLRHEYLSHLAPRHPSLSSNVREGWLMEVLLEEIRSQFPEGQQFDGPALDDFRDDLTGRRSDRGVHDLAVRIRALNSDVYWGYTGAMVSATLKALPDAAVFDRVLLQLMDEVPVGRLRSRIASCSWSGLQAFVDNVAGWI